MPYLHVYVIINSCLYGSKTVLAARARNDGQLCSGQHAPHTNGHNGYALLFDSHIQYIYCMWKTYISHSKTARTQTEQRTRFDSIAVCERRGAINTMRSDFLAFASYWGFDINWHVIFRLNSWALYSLSVCFFFFFHLLCLHRGPERVLLRSEWTTSSAAIFFLLLLDVCIVCLSQRRTHHSPRLGSLTLYSFDQFYSMEYTPVDQRWMDHVPCVHMHWRYLSQFASCIHH